ncbi:hypothetical protein ACKAV7_009792 [Fusarium commune]
MVAQASSGLIAYGILQMRGIAGLSGWQWMFLLEGMLTIVVGVVFALLMPNSPGNPSTLLVHMYFTPREVHILTTRINVDNPEQDKKHKWVRLADIKSAFSRWYIYPQLLISFCSIAIVAPMLTYVPSIIAGYGYDRLQANALSSVGSWIVVVLNLTFGYIADKTQRRGPIILFSTLANFSFSLATRQLAPSKNRTLKYGILICTQMWGSVTHPLNGSWLAVNVRNPAERSITMALVVMMANSAGIAGGQIFQEHDKPLYRTGFTVILALAATGFLFVCVANLQYFWLNKKLDSNEQSEEQLEAAGEGTKWRFSQ